MPDPVVCTQCGARNPPAAGWCGQCFASLGDSAESEQRPFTDGDLSEPPTAVRMESAEQMALALDGEGQASGSAAGSKAGTWVCSVCELSNPLEVEECSACGTSIFAAFGAVVEEDVQLDAQRALLRSIMFPGIGHAYVKQGLLGAAIGGLALMSLGFGIGLAVSGVGGFGWPLILLGIGVWVAAAFDAFRIANDQTTKALLLRPRVVTALVGSVVVQLILAAFLRGTA